MYYIDSVICEIVKFWYNCTLLQVEYSDDAQPCLAEELLALQGEWLYFDKPVSGGKSPSFRFPGIFFNNPVFKRIQ